MDLDVWQFTFLILISQFQHTTHNVIAINAILASDPSRPSSGYRPALTLIYLPKGVGEGGPAREFLLPLLLSVHSVLEEGTITVHYPQSPLI